MAISGEAIARRTVIAALAVFILLLAVLVWQSVETAQRNDGGAQTEQYWIDAYALARAIEGVSPDAASDLGPIASSIGVKTAFAIYAPNGASMEAWAPPGQEKLLSEFPAEAPALEPHTRVWPIEIPAASGRGHILALQLHNGRILTVAHPGRRETPWIRTIAAYQAMTLVVAIITLMFVLHRISRRLRERLDLPDAQTPQLADGVQRETDFVVETFQSMIGELQNKGRQLELLSQRERERADRSERFSERVIDQMPAGLVVVARSGRITAANRSARDLFGDLPSGRTESMDYARAFRDAPELIRIVGECLQQGALLQRREIEMRTQTGTGRVRFLGVSVSPISPPLGEPEAALCLMSDLTEIVGLRDRVRLQENLANLGEMAAGLAHELKNSLATIQGFAQLIADLAPDRAGEPSEALVDEVRELTQMVTDFLNFAKPQNLSLVQIPVVELIESVTSRFEERAARARVQIHVAVQPGCEGLTVAGDETLLGRAIGNLIQNAIDAVESVDGERRIDIHAGYSTTEEVAITVRDTGQGIPVGDLAKIFIPFFTTRARGYGIGLALTQKILLSHGGKITAENTSPGAIFRCVLPAHPDAADPPR